MINFFLVDFSVIRPEIGLLFWTVVIFLLVWGILGATAFKPIQNALSVRETGIQNSIDEAKRVQAQMAQLKEDNTKLLAEAREESIRIVSDAEAYAKQRRAEAIDEAKAAAQKVSADAQRDIANMRDQAMVDLKREVGNMAIDVAEKVLRKDLKSDISQTTLVNELVKNLN
ncbi:F0F1 ATP synthase subunit B [Neolewinella antarctica]|uniref:ATP synthase subunit b n=1 Tax=Neolewinella antarctica TaxID=442734 RepID=A0ABX0XC31_9BACT|nr:F0F1 ATP synthase subunit B [Neolewinella antarctica]NJC26821.1 F-type H+-transporting ATPase subunit b [Neolewinella antarctica]